MGSEIVPVGVSALVLREMVCARDGESCVSIHVVVCASVSSVYEVLVQVCIQVHPFVLVEGQEVGDVQIDHARRRVRVEFFDVLDEIVDYSLVRSPVNVQFVNLALDAFQSGVGDVGV